MGYAEFLGLFGHQIRTPQPLSMQRFHKNNGVDACFRGIVGYNPMPCNCVAMVDSGLLKVFSELCPPKTVRGLEHRTFVITAVGRKMKSKTFVDSDK